MDFFKEEGQQDEHESECPVCYESLSGTERTLSCGHVFCHDCLVKTLVSINKDGNISDTIICPICRHLTFIRKQKEAAVLLANKDPDEGQTLEVPLPLSLLGQQLQSAQRRASGDGAPSGFHRIARCLREIPERVRRHRLVSPGQNASQIFFISAQGRPMAEEDALSVVMTVVQPRRRRRRSFCTTARCLFFLLSVFTILALVAATLPWILLA
ncbi:RING finger protein 222 [Genypterus blacodes]|uniref:RING finger protein 222 n=1 Tax=Genypterus blacodes TaxID=154954 RepID=UPI003F75EB70